MFALFANISLQHAHAHAIGENYVWLNVDESHVEGRFELNFLDMKNKLGLDVSAQPESAAIGKQQIEDALPVVTAYLREHFKISASGEPVAFEIVKSKLFNAEGSYAQYFFKSEEFTMPDKLEVSNTIFLEDDAFHRGLLLMEYNKKTGEEYGAVFISHIFSPSKSTQTVDLLNMERALAPLDFIWQGVLHIWIGIDHILFLVVLLIPAVLTRSEGKWVPVENIRTAFWNILRIVTIFTVAHSITLSLAALEIVQLSSALVESTIALSILLVGLNVLYPKIREGSSLVIFFFGLFHGLGFASVMGELPFRITELVKVLFTFNVGVELGQLAIVAIAFPLLFWLSRTRIYQPIVLKAGTAAICIVATYWFYERAIGF